MQLVVVDLGTDATPDRMEWVIEACSGALSNGRCVPEGHENESSPEAVAIVRVRDTEGRAVRIEIGRRREERAAWSVRELQFESGDPAAECWRSVGLALATLVGEIEQARHDAEGESAPALTDPATPGEDLADGGVDEPFPRPQAFVGFGALAGQGSRASLLRWGGSARLAWVFDSKLQLSMSGDYSAVAAEPGLELDWLRFTTGAGYRYFASDRWSLGVSLRLGVRGLGVEAQDEAGRRGDRDWSVLGLSSADVWWQVTSFGGLWLEMELSSIGRRTRLIARDGSVESELPLGDATGSFGVWFAP